MLGFVGVDFENLLNEVVFLVVWCDWMEIDVVDIDEVEDCVIVGLVKCDWVILLWECNIVVYYEVGYMIVGLVLNDVWVVYKVMIVLWGCVGGYVIMLLCEDEMLMFKKNVEE